MRYAPVLNSERTGDYPPELPLSRGWRDDCQDAPERYLPRHPRWEATGTALRRGNLDSYAAPPTGGLPGPAELAGQARFLRVRQDKLLQCTGR